MLPFSKTLVFIYIWITIKPSAVTALLTKFILVWTNDQEYTHDKQINTRRGDGQVMFSESNCPVQNCYITDDKNFFGKGNENRFDAILFNGRNIDKLFKDVSLLPRRGSTFSKPKYIFVFAEPICNSTVKDCNDTIPVCNAIFDNFFNWTATYKKNSDIVFSTYENSLRQKMFMACKDHIGRKLLPDLRQKKKAVVWFVSNCTDKEKQFEYATNLEKSLLVYGQTLDIYGCEKLSPKENRTENDLLRDEYFFYLDFEPFDNVLNECPFAHNSVPIVYGLDNYSRFMPLGTFINAAKYMPESLATSIAYYVNNPDQYSDFYTYRDYEALYVPPNARAYHCLLCAAINNKQKIATDKIYHNFRHWWNPNYYKLCFKTKYNK